MRRIIAACFSLALLLAVAGPGQAQLGGLKKKIADKVTKKPDTTVVAGTGSGRPKCDKSSIVITGDVVDRYLKGLAARKAEVQKISREPGPIGDYHAASLRRQAVERRKTEFELRRGPDWERYKPLYLKMVKGDQEALKAQQALSDSLDPSRVQVPNLEWESQQKGNARLDSVAIAASGVSACDWGGTGLGERIPQLVNILVNDPETKDLQGFGTPQEGAAVKSRLKELSTALGYRGRDQSKTEADQARTEAEQAHIKEEDEKLVEASMMTGDAYTDCASMTTREYMKKHQAELDKLSKDKDVNGIMNFSRLQQQEVAKQCSKFQSEN